MSALDHKIKTAAEKPPLDLLPLRALIGAARAFQHGTIKYQIGNYLRAPDDEATANRYGGAALRHLADMQGLDGVFGRPDAIDAESGLPHIDHLIATLVMLRSILIQSGRLPADPGRSRFVRGEHITVEAWPDGGGPHAMSARDLDALTGLAARESARDENTWRGYTGPAAPETTPTAPHVTDDAYWQRHPLGSPERVQAVEEHRAARVAL